MTDFYLYDHPNPNAPIRSNGIRFWGYPQRTVAVPRIVVVHTAENIPDIDPPDRGAEAIASYFAHTSRPVSAHSVTDSDTTIRLLPDEAVGFHVRGYNTPGWGIEIATQADSWTRVPSGFKELLLRRAADECARVVTKYGIPIRYLTRAQVDAGLSGFTGHTQLDPDRRRDPGFTPARWTQFLSYVQEAIDPMAHEHTPMPDQLPRPVFDGVWRQWVEVSGTIPATRTHDFYREDMAWVYDRVIKPIEQRCDDLEVAVRSLTIRVAELEAGGGGGAHDHDDTYVRLGTPITIEGT